MTPIDDGLDSLLQDVVFWGRRLELHLERIDERQFHADAAILDAACWCMLCIGEAAGRLKQRYPAFAELRPALELHHAHAMRHRLAHGYDSLDPSLLWFAATVSVPTLVREAAGALLEHGKT